MMYIKCPAVALLIHDNLRVTKHCLKLEREFVKLYTTDLQHQADTSRRSAGSMTYRLDHHNVLHRRSFVYWIKAVRKKFFLLSVAARSMMNQLNRLVNKRFSILSRCDAMSHERIGSMNAACEPSRSHIAAA